MNKHLPSDQLPRLIIGDCSLEAQQHVRDCPECQAEFAGLQSTLSSFRDSVRNWADPQCPSVIALPFGRRATPLRWILATLGLFLAVAIPVYQNAIERERQAQAAQDELEELEELDELLLEQIDAHLSRAVPAAIEPFMELISDEMYSTSDREGEVQ